MLKVKQFSFNPFGVNTYVVWDDATRQAMVVDPGMTDASEQKMFDKYIADNSLTVKYVVNTHMHLDHVFGDNYVRDRYGVKIHAHPADAPLGESVDRQSAMFGAHVPASFNTSVDVPLSEGDRLMLGDYVFDVIEVPGHSPGGIALYCPQGEFAIVGDSIFAGSIGRTDLPGGDHDTLIGSLRQKILTLPDNTRLLTGHDMSTTVAREKTNPFIV
ncbi:MAG: MBL fold metallo-hydrolase [Muribaculaceae bacterium]|nr:MBL fold metallo-hydrolase [Muribaculaceae bacterium]MDE6611461.1 MBL fold metallo-hydrolase [Muribaculaceae bacterium]